MEEIMKEAGFDSGKHGMADGVSWCSGDAVFYRIVFGDSLDAIAERFAVSRDQIMKMNSDLIGSSGRICAGWEIRVA